MKLKYILFFVGIFVFCHFISHATIQESIIDVKVKASLVRVNSLGIFTYSCFDENGVKIERNYFTGGVCTGVLIDSSGYILVSKNSVLDALDFEYDFESFSNKISEQILDELIQQKEIQSSEEKTRWKEERRLTITSTKFVNIAVLTNGTSYPFTILNTDQNIEDQKLMIIKIEHPNVPCNSVTQNEGDFDKDKLYQISGSFDLGEIKKYYTNLGYNFSFKVEQIRDLFDFGADELITWKLINEKKENSGIKNSGIWFDEKGKIKAFLIAKDNNTQIVNNSQIYDELKIFNIDFFQNGDFNNELENLIKNFDSNSSKNNLDILERMGHFFFNFSAISELKTAILNENGESSDREQFLSRDNLSTIIKEYKLYVIVLSFMLVLIILLFLVFRKKKHKKPIFGLPEESSDDSPTTLSNIIRQELKDYIDVFINDEYHNSYGIKDGVIHIGRDPLSADVIISELIVSKLHCTIQVREDKYYIIDKNSTNGIYDEKANKITDEMELSDGDEVSLGRKGKVKIVFHTQKLIDPK